jgi:CheY-like chemotaxis protein
MKKILIADDEQNIRTTFRMCLEVAGYEVREACDGNTALDEILKFKPDVVLLDLRMPAQDGIGVLEKLAALGLQHHPQVIVLTAYGTIQTAKRAIQLGAFDFLEKPITPDVLRGAVEEALKAREPLPAAHPKMKDILSAAREALVQGDVVGAEALLMDAKDLHEGDPAYLNLVGVVHEFNLRWEQAHRFYGKAVYRKYDPAQKNLQRHYELENFGSSEIPITLGEGLTLPANTRIPQEKSK